MKPYVYIVAFYFLNDLITLCEIELSVAPLFTDYRFWYPRWGVPRPVVCDPLCIFVILPRMMCFSICTIIVLLIQSQFPNTLLEQQLVYASGVAEGKPEHEEIEVELEEDVGKEEDILEEEDEEEEEAQ